MLWFRNWRTNGQRRVAGASAVTWFGALVVLTAATLTTLFIIERRREVYATAHIAQTNIVLALAEHLARTIQSVDVITRSVAVDSSVTLSQGSTLDAATPNSLEDRIAGVPQIRNLLLVDADGDVLRQSQAPERPGVNVADREYFQAVKAGFKLLYMGIPARSRLNGTWLLPMARRIEGASNQFLGIVLAALEPIYFEKLFGAVVLGPESAISLFREDGTKLVSFPHDEHQIGLSFATMPIFTGELRSATFGSFKAIDPVGGGPRIVSYRRVPGYPLVVTTSITDEAVLAPWFREAVVVGTGSGSGCILFGALVFGLARQLRRAEGATAQLEESERRYRTLLETAQEGIVLVDPQLRLEYVNPRMLKISGYNAAEIVGRPLIDFFGEENRHVVLRMRELRQAGELEQHELRFPGPRGSNRWMLLSANLRFARDRTCIGWLILGVDITDRKLAEDDLRRRAMQQQTIAALAQLALEEPDLDVIFQSATEVLAHTLGADFSKLLELSPSKDKLILRAGAGWEPGVIGSVSVPVGSRSHGGYVLVTDEPVVVADLLTEDRFELPALLRDHGVRSGITVVVSRPGEQQFGTLGVHSRKPRQFSANDINFVQSAAHLLSAAIKRHEDAAKRQEDASAVQEQRTRLQGILDTMDDGVITMDQGGRIESLNRAAEQLFGYLESELLGQEISILMPVSYPENEIVATYLDLTVRRRIGKGSRDLRGLRKDGQEFPIDLAIGEVELGTSRLFIATIRDLTERKAAEEQLRQAQKMEAVGQLTGGIAHDFNNLLTVVLGNAELLEEELAGQHDLSHLAEVARKAAERGAELTSRMLAFSRRQPLRPTQLDLNQVAVDTRELLSRTLGEHVEIELRCAADLGNAIADRTQLETALINLAVNARDAMPGGGLLTIETANVVLDEDDADRADDVQPGDYIMLAVSDTGHGMAPDVKARVFEPFFTTKDVGQGSGLGLSMVYGFVKQSGGQIWIYSEVGHGTTVKLYLPSADAQTDHAVVETARGSPPAGKGETILVVEDDTAVRNYVTTQLRRLGYDVVEADDGPSAIELLGRVGHVHLLFTDVVMPGGLTGWELAERAREVRPGLNVLFTSGYTEAGLARGGRLNPGTHLLQKPYRRNALAEAIRSALQGASGEWVEPARGARQ